MTPFGASGGKSCVECRKVVAQDIASKFIKLAMSFFSEKRFEKFDRPLVAILT